MAWTVRAIGLICLATYPVGLSAQGVSYPNQPMSANDVVPVAYEPPAYSQGAATTEPRQALSPDRSRSTAVANERLPLKAHSSTDRTDANKSVGGLQRFVTVGGSLAAVLGVFFVFVWVLRRASPSGQATLPGEAFEVLGRAPLANSQQAHLLRCGSKLLLVSVSATGAQTLAEITDPEEVDRLAELCRQSRPGRPVASFRQVFRQAEKRHAN
jgi:flagellar protein FliO/FliZ